MASASTSSTQKSFKYDVFLSFRGEDTRKNFVDHLYHALQQKNIVTYKDDKEMKKGKMISDELFRSIEESKLYVIIFSKNYASSSWCLDELVKIMECQKTNEHTAYPVFYDVKPTEVRKQIGVVGEAFTKYKEDDAEKWREALTGAANLVGWELKDTLDGREAEFIQKIVEEVSLDLRFINLSVDGKLVGMKKRVKDVVSSLEIDTDDVRIIGIKGIGGGGKTTLARAVYDQISFRFEGSSFVENVREFSKNPMCGLKSLQKQVLSDVLNKQDITVTGVYEGKKMMKLRMCVRKVLVVLDDVDHIDQLEALASEPSWFKLGSRIIITTRDEQVLLAHQVPKNLILDVNLLSHKEATCLFNRYAFGREIPNQSYEILSDKVIRYAAGLPLTIRVLGSFLCGKDELEWIDALERLKKIPLKETLEILEISYKSLEEDYKEIFLDVACMLKGWDEELAIIALECRGLHARNGLRVLERKSLITISRSGRLDMHDHIEEMGQNIVRRLHPNKPYKHSRLWIQDEIGNILVEGKGTKAIKCMKVCNINPIIVMKGLRKMKELRFLDVMIREKKVGFDFADYDLNYNDNGEDSLYLPNGLQYLLWHGYPFTCLPPKFQANNLVSLKMHSSNIIQLWEGGERKVLKKLRFIDLHLCKLRFLDIRLIPNVERLTLVACKELIEIHMPAENHKLKFLTLRRSKLRTLDLRWAHHLEELNIIDNEDLVELHFPSEKLKCLQLRRCKIKTLNLTGSRNLQRLDLEQCEHLLELHMSVENPKLEIIKVSGSKMRTLNLIGTQNLKSLDLEQCKGLVELDMPNESPKLKIKIYYSLLRTLNLTGAWNIKMLALERCEDLQELHMPIESPELKTMKVSGSKMRTLNLIGTQNLERLDLNRCDDLLELHMPSESHQLETIKIGCAKLRTLNLSGTRNLEMLDLEQCDDLLELHMPIESPRLETIKISSLKLKTLTLTGTRNLERLDLEHCEDLVELHMPKESHKLKAINIHCSKLRTLKLGISPYLECLDLHDCFTLEEISGPVGCLSGSVRFIPYWVNHNFPMVCSLAELHLKARSAGTCTLHPENDLPKFHFECVYRELLPLSTRNLEKLITFGLCACTNLVSLSESICGLQRLRKLTLEGSIPQVPKAIDQLECLEELSLLSTEIEYLPDSICTLKDLKILRLKSCCFLKQLPENIVRLECLEELHLTDCTSLRDIPNSICEMKRLNSIHLRNCTLVEKLPKDMGRLTCLKQLHIEGTGIIYLPESIYQLEDLIFSLDGA